MVSTLENLLHIKVIYCETSSLDTSVYNQVRARFPDAEIKEISSHWKIPELHLNEDLVDRYVKVKKNYLVLGSKKKIYFRENGRSTDYIGMSHSSGCAAACNFCFVQRRKGLTNPITIFTNIDEILSETEKHSKSLGIKSNPNQCDPTYWTYDIGENSDCSVDATLSDNLYKIINLFSSLPNSKACFATKFVNRDLLSYNPQRKTRIRFSLSPPHISKLLDVRTTPIVDRINALEDFYQAGYEVHINFSPVVVYNQDDNDWRVDYPELFTMINDSVSEDFKKQAKCEVIFLTHNEDQHNLNLKWHPKGESYIWKPDWQEYKTSQTGGKNIRYKYQIKNKMIQKFKEMHYKHIPWCNIRYIF